MKEIINTKQVIDEIAAGADPSDYAPSTPRARILPKKLFFASWEAPVFDGPRRPVIERPTDEE
jgi:hypothetical protein